MKTSQALGHRTEQTARSALLFVLVGAAIVSGVGVAAIWRHSRKAPDQVQYEGSRVGNVMGTRGDAIENPLVGHEFRFRIYGRRHRMHILQSARQNDSGALRGEYFAAPCASVPEHTHRRQEERFEVVSGTLGVRVGGRELSLSPGQNAVGPPGVPHEWWNPSDEEEVHFLFEVWPGLDVETTLETVRGLARDGKTIGMVPKNPLQLVVLAHELGSWMVLKPGQKALFALVASLAFVGRLLGYRASYPKYSGSKATGPNEQRKI